MAVPRLRVPTVQPGGSLRQAAGLLSDEVELYHRTYTTLLRSSGETLLRVLEPSHAAMSSSLHALAGAQEPDLGAFLYALRRLPAQIWRAHVIIMGQEVEPFVRAGIGRIDEWSPVEAPARRRRWFDSGDGTMAVLLASTSDLDNLIPTRVAYRSSGTSCTPCCAAPSARRARTPTRSTAPRRSAAPRRTGCACGSRGRRAWARS
jgi:hypothetical protein